MPLLEVHLANAGNPDHGENPERALPGTQTDYWQVVEDLAEASAVCRNYIESNNLGAGNWVGGTVRDPAQFKREENDSNEVARVSYNGKVWPAGKWDPGMVPLYDPAECAQSHPERDGDIEAAPAFGM